IIVYTFLIFLIAVIVELFSPYHIYKVFRWIPCFFSGILFSKFLIFSKINKKTRLFLPFTLLLLCVIIRNIYNTSTGSNHLDFIIAPVFIISVVLLSEKCKNKGEIFNFFGEYSSYMWLVHSFFIYYYFQGFILLIQNPIIIYIWTILLSTITANLLSKISSIFLK